MERVFQHSLLSIREQIDTCHLNLDGSRAVTKKGGEGFILATTGIVAGNHNDAFELKDAVCSC